jgi:hypothetical protein
MTDPYVMNFVDTIKSLMSYPSGTKDILQYLGSRWLLLSVLFQKVVLSGPPDDLTHRQMIADHSANGSVVTTEGRDMWFCTTAGYLVVYVRNVHAVEHVIFEIVHQNPSEDIKRYVRSEKQKGIKSFHLDAHLNTETDLKVLQQEIVFVLDYYFPEPVIARSLNVM